MSDSQRSYSNNRSHNIFTGGLEVLLLDALENCSVVDENGVISFDRDRAKDLIDEYLNQRLVGRGS